MSTALMLRWIWVGIWVDGSIRVEIDPNSASYQVHHIDTSITHILDTDRIFVYTDAGDKFMGAYIREDMITDMARVESAAVNSKEVF